MVFSIYNNYHDIFRKKSLEKNINSPHLQIIDLLSDS